MSARELIEAEFIETVSDPAYWRQQGDNDMADLMELEQELRREFPELKDLDLASRSNGAIHVQLIRVKPEFRGHGIGSKVIQRIQKFATEKQRPITLSPEPEPRQKANLQRFYRRHGFWPNKGRRADYRFTSPFGPTMMWRPPEASA